MKILYVKNNSERAKEYQLKTIIFEENGIKFVKKEALCDEAIPHLKKMKENYDTLTNAIIDPKVKLAKIIAEDTNSLTFEFIEGVSLEKKFNQAMKKNDSTKDEIVKSYLDFLKTSFKTTQTVEEYSKNDNNKYIFSNIDFKKSDNFIYFEDISNIDLIFSNIIYKDDEIYLIDYEWVFPLSLPISYALYRSLRAINTHRTIDIEAYIDSKHLETFNDMEKTFFDNEVISEKSFFKIKNNYNQNRVNNYVQIENFRNQVHHLQSRILELERELENTQDEVVSYVASKSWKITRPIRQIANYIRSKI